MSGVSWTRLCRAALVGLVVLSVTVFSGRAGAQTGLDFEFYLDNVEPIFIQSRGDFLPPDPGDPAWVLAWEGSTRAFRRAQEQWQRGGPTYVAGGPACP